MESQVGGAGEGKSTLAAMMQADGGGGGGGFIHAAHYCKRADATRQARTASRRLQQKSDTVLPSGAVSPTPSAPPGRTAAAWPARSATSSPSTPTIPTACCAA
jgi:hypothetical protein